MLLYGIRGNYPLSLKNRFWAKLVEKLVLKPFHKDQKDKEIYHFYNQDDSPFATIRIAKREKDVGPHHVEKLLIELLGFRGNVLAKEEIPYLYQLGYSYHPLSELFDIVEKDKDGLKEVREIVEINKFL